ncbi:MAG: hypothetical protein ACRDJW_26085 [Thermomicrobiales bacterium]
MEWWNAGESRLGRSGALLAAYCAIVGLVSVVVSIGPAVDGEVPAVARAFLGLLGLAGGVLLWPRQPVGLGWMLCMVWAVIQIPFYAWNTEGSPTEQFIAFPITASSRTTVNGEVTSFSEIGVNVVGIVLATLLARRRERLQRPAVSPAV